MALITTSSPPLQKMVHPKTRALRKFCFCINLRAGVVIACLVWAALGLYFAALAFQGQSPFYSYLASSALTVSGVINLVMVLVGFFGVVAAWNNEGMVMRNLSHFVWAMMLLLLGDHFINVIIFGTNQADFRVACAAASQHSMNEQIQAAFPNGTSIALAFNTNNDFYNCDKLWVDELKFAVLAYVFIFLIYIYWATTIWSFSHKRTIIEANFQKANAQQQAITAGAGNPIHPGGVVPVPPVGSLPVGMGGGMQMPMGAPGMGRGNIIVLNNEKPSKKSKTPPATKTPPVTKTPPAPSPAGTPPDNTRRDSGYSKEKPFFGFKIGYDGAVRELGQQDVDVELGLAAQAADGRYEIDMGSAEDLNGAVEYYDGRSSAPHSKRSSRILTRKPVSPLQNSSNEHFEYVDYGDDYNRHGHYQVEIPQHDTEEADLR